MKFNEQYAHIRSEIFVKIDMMLRTLMNDNNNNELNKSLIMYNLQKDTKI